MMRQVFAVPQHSKGSQAILDKKGDWLDEKVGL